jgi:hypothetical protein
MSYCKRMKRPCTCNRLTVYQRDGRVSDQDNGASCLTDSEIRGAVPVLLEEWRRRFSDAEVGAVSLYA